MNSARFNEVVENGHKRTISKLVEKQKEYASDKDVLQNFRQGAAFRGSNAADSLFWYTTKHLQSISEMVKNPLLYPLPTWHEKLDDVRNYMHLLEAVVLELGVNQESSGCFNCSKGPGEMTKVARLGNGPLKCGECGRIL